MAIFSSTRRRFSRRPKAPLTPARFLLGAGILILLLVLGGLRFFAPGYLDPIFAPLWQAGNASAHFMRGLSAIFLNRVALVAERDALRAENAALRIEFENVRLREEDLEASFGRTPSGTGILAAVISRPPISPYDVLVIDRGSESGIGAGDLALGPGGVPVGRVGSAGQTTARILLFSSFGTEEAVWVGKKHTPATLRGEGSGAFSIALPKTAPGDVGDAITLVGASGALIGTVEKIEEDPTSPTKNLFVQNALNLFSISWVRILPSRP